MDEELLLSLAWAENSFHATRASPAGALGLLQVMPLTWAKWAPKVGASDPHHPRDSARVGAAYLAHLLRYYEGDVRRAVTAYNFGMGNVDAGREPPLPTVIYREKIVHGRDLLKVVLG